MFLQFWYYIRSFIIIYLALFLGNGVGFLLPITIPGSILGMLILFFALTSGLLPVAWVKPGCTLLIRYMALLFVPIGVSIIKYYDQLVAQFGPIIISCLVSSLLTMLVVAFSAHFTYQSNEK